jgi:hypothetical protein
MPGAFGVFAQLGRGPAAPVTEGYEFVADRMRCYEEVTSLAGINGSRSEQQNRNKVTRLHIDGEIVSLPNAKELALLLPRGLGAAAAGNVFNVTNTLPEYFITSDRGTNVHTWNNCKTGRMSFNARENGGLELTEFIVGKTETKGAAGTMPALTIDETTQNFILPELACTIGGTPFAVDGAQFVIDNQLRVRFANSLTATDITPTRRIVTFNTRVPWGDAAALYVNGASAIPIVLTFTSGGTSLNVSFPACKWPKSTPTVDDFGELWLPIDARCLASGTTPEVTFTLDSTP